MRKYFIVKFWCCFKYSNYNVLGDQTSFGLHFAAHVCAVVSTCMRYLFKRSCDCGFLLQVVASETLALGASEKNLSTVLNTQVMTHTTCISFHTFFISPRLFLMWTHSNLLKLYLC